MIMSSEHKTLIALSTTVVCGFGLYLAYRYFYRKRPVKKLVVKSLYIYPVKSCGGIKVDQIEVTKTAVLLDRLVLTLQARTGLTLAYSVIIQPNDPACLWS